MSLISCLHPPRLPSVAALLCALLAATAPSTPAAEATARVFAVRDFGALPDQETDAGPGIRNAIAAALRAGPDSVVVFDPGTYPVRPAAPRTPVFSLHAANRLTLRGAGPTTRILVRDPAASAFTLDHCTNATLRDLAIDYDPLPFTQGTVRHVDPAAGSFDLELDSGYPTPDQPNFIGALEPYGKWGMIIDRSSRRIRSGTPDHYMTPRWQHQAGRVWRFFTTNEHHRLNLTHMRPGDAYVHLARGHGSAVLAHLCDSLRFEHLTLHASPGLALGLVGNQGEITVRHLQVRFPTNSSRLLTTNADGVHGQQNRTGPIIEDCYFEGMADDAINLYAPPNVLREIRSPTEWLVSPGARVLPGDRFQVLDPRTGQVRGQVKALRVEPQPRAWLLTIDPPLPDATAGRDHLSGDTLYNLDACGAGFQIRRNHMNGHRRYGCLLRAGQGVVEQNTFAHTTGAGVVLTNEPDWPEGPMPWDITIRNNRFLGSGTCRGYADSPHGAALVVRATRLGHQLAESQPIHNLTIVDNEFSDPHGAAVFVGGARQVQILNNRVHASSSTPRLRHGSAILVERSAAVILRNQTIIDPRPETTAALEIGPDVPSADSGLSVQDLRSELATGSRAILDRRSPAR